MSFFQDQEVTTKEATEQHEPTESKEVKELNESIKTGLNINDQGKQLVKDERISTSEGGEIVVKKQSGKLKIRKGQSEEHYQAQKDMFYSTGPFLNTEDWLFQLDIGELDFDLKVNHVKLIHFLENLYFRKMYDECLLNCNLVLDKISKNADLEKENKNKKNYKMSMCANEVGEIKQRCLNKKTIINDENK
ncbi:hypothetical protein PACTADRAFT_185849 [Pachysolen tannophilus NRRL Y-2460]|uniref:Uncharacterized protein n=1 Tax=Pachysolen tannophilus NRRL Y-2460 TaxID=669874 RepID=A0A1E4U1J0_PACTA|nr:hypothetical protein PACTADRAFT_185849 [Pachysolen tannophilus NRRL Y-2460]